MGKYQHWNQVLCDELCDEMKAFEEMPNMTHLKCVKDLIEAISGLQEIEAAGAMRQIAEEYGYDSDTAEFNIYDAVRRKRDRRGRFMPQAYADDMRPRMPRTYDRRDYDQPDQPYMLRQEGGRPIFTPYARHDPNSIPKKMTPEQYEDWMHNLVNDDGTDGAKWSKQDFEGAVKKAGMDVSNFNQDALWAATNMMYSDYCGVAKKFGVDRPDFYICMAKAFLDDADFDGDGTEKLSIYYHEIVKEG